jgi:hypothetical protein
MQAQITWGSISVSAVASLKVLYKVKLFSSISARQLKQLASVWPQEEHFKLSRYSGSSKTSSIALMISRAFSVVRSGCACSVGRPTLPPPPLLTTNGSPARLGRLTAGGRTGGKTASVADTTTAVVTRGRSADSVEMATAAGTCAPLAWWMTVTEVVTGAALLLDDRC